LNVGEPIITTTLIKSICYTYFFIIQKTLKRFNVKAIQSVSFGFRDANSIWEKKQNLAAILINLGQTLTKTGSFSVRSEHIMPFYAYCQRKTFNDAFYHRNNELTEMGLTGTGTQYLTHLLL
jgi:hypothetical protein